MFDNFAWAGICVVSVWGFLFFIEDQPIDETLGPTGFMSDETFSRFSFKSIRFRRSDPMRPIPATGRYPYGLF